MKTTRGRWAAGIAGLVLMGCLPTFGAAQSASLGRVTVAGPVLIDGQQATSATPIAGTARLATGDGGTVTMALANGGEIRMNGQSDVIVSMAGNRLQVHLLCGEVTVASTAPALVLSTSGARILAIEGTATITTGGQNEQLKRGKSRDFGGQVTAMSNGVGSTVSAMSTHKCDCGCGNAFGGRTP